jgi:hypothetical protein
VKTLNSQADVVRSVQLQRPGGAAGSRSSRLPSCCTNSTTAEARVPQTSLQVSFIDVRFDIDVSSTINVDDARHVDLDDEGRVGRIEALWASAGRSCGTSSIECVAELRPLLEDIENHTFKPAASHA